MPEESPYRPFGASDAEYRERLVLRDGVPAELLEPLIAWIVQLSTSTGSASRLVDDTANKVRSLSGVDMGARTGDYVWREDLIRNLRGADGQSLLRIADALLYLNPDKPKSASNLEASLQMARSKWMVGRRDGHPGLVDRVDEGEAASVERLVSSGPAGTLLSRSFSAAFGLQPNPGEAYKMAVKAVETAAHATIEPNNTGATLGTMLAVMRNSPVKWTLPLEERADHVNGNRDMIIAMAQSLWDGQEDRHRDGEVDLKEARAAFHAAVALVGWLHDGLVVRGPQ